ncbi:MAG: HAD-IC family P-type ATPase [Bacilli bacterium]|nr:HAD-IC family P-type ATPase [Bacilli bacterium]
MDWYSLNINEVLDKVNSRKTGLSNKEASAKLKKYGVNELPKQKEKSILGMIIDGIKDPICLLLIITAIFCLIIGEFIDAITITFIVVVDLILGTFQEYKAEKTKSSLSNMIDVKTLVLRDDMEYYIDSKLIVKGDILVLSSGDKIVADARIIECSNFTTNESALTGESINVEKTSGNFLNVSSIADCKNMVFSGTTVMTGRAKVVVVETSNNTEIGKIANTVINMKSEKTPLSIRMEKFSKQITITVFSISLIIFLLLYLKGYAIKEIFLLVISLFVSAMPEGLPLSLTMALTIGSNRMSKNNVIVKKLSSAESLGSCTLIATDKTGTLTLNEQTLKRIIMPNIGEITVSGTGYNDKGKVQCINCNISDARKIAKLGVINNEASLFKEKGIFQYYGDSIDIAFLSYGLKLGVKKGSNIIYSIPYESENKYSAVFYKENDKTYCTVKGSLEVVSKFSKTLNGKRFNKTKVNDENERLASLGYRVICIASGEVENKDSYTVADIKKLDFKCLAAFIDPIRKDVNASLEETKKAGIKVVMITGDHPLTAFSIAKQLNLAKTTEEIVTGMELDEYLKKGEKEFDEFIKDVKVFSRVTPLQKYEIVNSFKRQGEFVAVTGDGVNDAPALKSASIGVAMGSGTDVAKDSSDMIIVDDSFKSITKGIKEGRIAYSNIRKVSFMLLSCGLAEVLFFLLTLILNLPTPLLAIQLLWLNVVTDGLQDFSLSFEKAEDDIMNQKPRNTHDSLFDRKLVHEVIVSGISIGLVVFVVWLFLMINNVDVTLARGYIMTLMVFIQNIHVLNCRSEDKSIFDMKYDNKLLFLVIIVSIMLQILVIKVPFLSNLLKVKAFPISHMIVLFTISIVILLIMEVYKCLKNKSK